MDDATVVFEQQRARLRAVASRVLGSVDEADDAVQEAWLRLDRADVSDIANLPAWLTTVVSRLCLDRLRARAARREAVLPDRARPDATDPHAAAPHAAAPHAAAPYAAPYAATPRALDPAAEAEHADDVGRALLVVLDTLGPAERLAFCLHDLFGLSFDEVGAALGRSPAACRQLASRARRRVQGRGADVESDRARQDAVVAAFLDAARNGRFDRLLALLHPEAVVSSDPVAAAMGSPVSLRGADEVARFFDGRAAAARLTDLDGFAGASWSHRGELRVVFAFAVGEDGRITRIELLADDVARLDVRPRKVRERG